MESLKEDLRSHSQGQVSILATCGTGKGGGCHQPHCLMEPEYEKGTYEQKLKQLVLRFHELPESSGRWCRRNVQLRERGGEILAKSQRLWTTVQLQGMRRFCRNKVSQLKWCSLRRGQKEEQKGKAKFKEEKKGDLMHIPKQPSLTSLDRNQTCRCGREADPKETDCVDIQIVRATSKLLTGKEQVRQALWCRPSSC